MPRQKTKAPPTPTAAIRKEQRTFGVTPSPNVTPPALAGTLPQIHWIWGGDGEG